MAHADQGLSRQTCTACGAWHGRCVRLAWRLDFGFMRQAPTAVSPRFPFPRALPRIIPAIPAGHHPGPQYGQVAMSALGSGRACPATVIAFCPSCQLVAHPLSVRRTGVHPSTLPLLSTLAVAWLYWVRRTCRSGVTPSRCCYRSWPHLATRGRALWGPKVTTPGGGGGVDATVAVCCSRGLTCHANPHNSVLPQPPPLPLSRNANGLNQQKVAQNAEYRTPEGGGGRSDTTQTAIQSAWETPAHAPSAPCGGDHHLPECGIPLGGWPVGRWGGDEGMASVQHVDFWMRTHIPMHMILRIRLRTDPSPTAGRPSWSPALKWGLGSALRRGPGTPPCVPVRHVVWSPSVSPQTCFGDLGTRLQRDRWMALAVMPLSLPPRLPRPHHTTPSPPPLPRDALKRRRGGSGGGGRGV